MAKKDSLIITILIIAYVIIANTCIAQSHRDSICLPIFNPNENGKALLNEVLKTKHTLIEDKGAFIVSGKFSTDSLVIVNVLYDKTWMGYGLSSYTLPQYYGCVIYNGRLFMLDNSIKQVELFILNPPQHKKKFVDYGQMLPIINDQVVTWTFILIDGKFENTLIYPPGVIYDFDTECATGNVSD